MSFATATAGPVRARGLAGDGALVLLLLAAAMAIRVHAIGGPSLWVDEAASVVFAQASWRTLWITLPLTETNPPGYYAVLKLWIEAFGISDASVRMPSALASALGVVPLYFVALRAYGRRAAVLAAALLALSGLQIQYGQEARAFAMMTLAFLLALWTGGRIAADRVAGRPLHWGWLAAFVASCAALPYLHHTAYLAVGTAYVYILAGAALAGTLRLPLLRDLVLAGVAVLALSGPALYWIWVHMTAEATLVDWIRQPSPGDAYVIYRTVFGHSYLPHAARLSEGADALQWLANPRTIADGLLVLVCAWGLVQTVRERVWAIVAALAALGFVMATFFLFSQVRPILLPRVVVFASPLVALIAGIALASMRPRWLAAAAGALLLAFHATGSYRYFQAPEKEPWRDAMATAADLHAPGMPVLLVASEFYGPELVRMYWPGFAAAQGGVVTVLDMQPGLFPFANALPPERISITPDELCPAFAGADRLLVVERQSESRMAFVETVRGRLGARGAAPLEERRFGPHVVVSVWSAPSCPPQ